MSGKSAHQSPVDDPPGKDGTQGRPKGETPPPVPDWEPGTNPPGTNPPIKPARDPATNPIPGSIPGGEDPNKPAVPPPPPPAASVPPPPPPSPHKK